MKNGKGSERMTTVVKSTVNLNREYKEELERFVQMHLISSVTEGINVALEAYVKETQKAIYAKEMAAAAQDRAFVERTLSSQSEFDRMENDEPTSEDGEW